MKIYFDWTTATEKKAHGKIFQTESDEIEMVIVYVCGAANEPCAGEKTLKINRNWI